MMYNFIPHSEEGVLGGNCIVLNSNFYLLFIKKQLYVTDWTTIRV